MARNGEVIESRKDPAAMLSNRELLSEIMAEGSALVRKEVELAKAEIAENVKSELKMAKRLGVGALLALCGLNLALVTIVLALALVLPGWAAGLIVTGVVLGCAGALAAIAWSRRVRQPLALTRKHLKEDARWMKDQLS